MPKKSSTRKRQVGTPVTFEDRGRTIKRVTGLTKGQLENIRRPRPATWYETGTDRYAIEDRRTVDLGRGTRKVISKGRKLVFNGKEYSVLKKGRKTEI